MIDFVKNYYKSKVSEFKARTLENETVERFVKEASELVTERPDDGGYVRTSQVTDREKGHLQTNQLEMIRMARKYWRWDPSARGALQTLVNYIMGNTFAITPKTKDPVVWYIWREFWKADRNQMDLKQFEIPLRTFRDGDVFIEFFSRDGQEKETGKTTIRFIDPLLVRNPSKVVQGTVSNFNDKTTKSGIEHDAEDVEKIIGYWVQSHASINAFRFIKAEDMLHIKIFADSDQKRGETWVQPVMATFRQYQQWLDGRIILNKMRSAIVLIREVAGSSGQMQSIINNLAQASRTRTNENKRENIRGGTVLTASPGVKYTMLSPNINAADVKDDGRSIKLNIAAGLNLPEYVFGDAANANFASSLIAESPFVKSIQFWQVFLEYFFCQIYKHVINNAVKANMVKAPSDEEFIRKLKGLANLSEQAGEDNESPKEKAFKELMPEGKMETPTEIFFGCDMQWPEIIHRGVKEQTESLQIQRTEGWVSDQSASQILGHDYQEEVRKQKQAEEQGKATGNPLMGIKAKAEENDDDEKEMDDEINNILKSLSPEERQQILKSNNPNDVASLLMQKAGAAAGGNGNQPPQGGNQNA